MKIIVTGTDTGVGKTLLSSLLMASLDGYRYWKPIQSGLDAETDTETVIRQAEIAPSAVIPEAFRLRRPLSPHLAARLDDKIIARSDMQLPHEMDLIVEGAGGVMVPINERELFIDIFAHWQMPVIIATRSSLGTINHTLLTIEALRRRQIDILGCVTIGDRNEENEDAIGSRGAVEILGRIPFLARIDRSTLRDVYTEEFGEFRLKLR